MILKTLDDIEIRQASIEEKDILQNLMQLYMHDFSEISNLKMDERGLYHYPLDPYFTDPGKFAFLIRYQGELAGFDLAATLKSTQGMEIKTSKELFIVRKFRRKSVGGTALKLIFDLFPGPWHVYEILKNPSAQNFVRKVLTEYTGGNCLEFTEGDRVIQQFRSPGVIR